MRTCLLWQSPRPVSGGWDRRDEMDEDMNENEIFVCWPLSLQEYTSKTIYIGGKKILAMKKIICDVYLKNIHNLKVESSVSFSGTFWDFKPKRQHLMWPWKDYFKKARESGELGYIGVLQQWVSSGNIRRLVLKKIRNPNVRNLALFYVWEDVKVWAHWNHSFDIPQLSGASILCFYIPSHYRECRQSDGC